VKPEQEYDTYPVREGEVWTVGDHRVRCGDLRDWVAPWHTLVYSDPPWGNGPLSAFHTNAKLAKPSYDWSVLYALIIEKARFSAPIWLETGIRQEAQVMGMMSTPGLFTVSFEITYQRTHPCRLVYRGENVPPGALPGVLKGMNDTETPAVVLRAYPRGTVLDPCAGRGLTAVSAHFCGWKSESNELDPRRVSAALACLRQATGLTPEKVE
jgi:hypothetical protein